MSVKIEIDDSKVASSINNYFKSKNSSQAMAEIANVLDFAVSEQFMTEGKFLGTPWANLAPSTVKQRERKGYTPINILRRTGILFNSISTSFTNSSVTVGIGISYGKFHHFGTDKMPARPILPTKGLPKSMLDTIAKILLKYM